MVCSDRRDRLQHWWCVLVPAILSCGGAPGHTFPLLWGLSVAGWSPHPGGSVPLRMSAFSLGGGAEVECLRGWGWFNPVHTRTGGLPPRCAVSEAVFNLWFFVSYHDCPLVQNILLLLWEGMVQAALVNPHWRLLASKVVWQFILSFKSLFKLLTVLGFDYPYAQHRDSVNCDPLVAQFVIGYLSCAMASWHL